MKWAVISLLVSACSCAIGVPLFPNNPRCFIETAYRDEETIKVHVRFPPFEGQSADDGYYISWRDLTNQSTIKTKLVSGREWKQEFVPTKYHNYEFCYVLQTNKFIPKNSTVLLQISVDFNIGHNHSINSIQKKQLKTTAQNTQKILDILNTIEKFQQQRVKNQQLFFYQMHESIAWISVISFICFGCLLLSTGILLLLMRREFSQF